MNEEPSADSVLDDRRLGDGDFPTELDRVNWGALLLGFWWALSHRQLTWVGVFAGIWFAGLTLIWAALRIGPTAAIAASGLSLAVSIAASAVFALSANRLVWRGEHAVADRRAARGLAPADSIGRFKSSQRWWAIAGVIWFAMRWASTLFRSMSPSVLWRAWIMLIAEACVYLALVGIDRRRVVRRERS